MVHDMLGLPCKRRYGGTSIMKREISLNIHSSFNALKKNWWVIAAVTVLAFFAGFMYTTSLRDNEYTASTTIYGAAYGSYTESLSGMSAMKDYSTLIKTQKLAKLAAEMIGDPSLTDLDINEMIDYYEDPESAIMTITATATSPDTAIMICNAVAQTFADEVNKITGTNNVNILDEATVAPLSFSASRFQLIVRLGSAVAGFSLSCAVIILVVMFRDKIYSPEDATLGGRVNVIGVIPFVKNM